MCVIHVHMLDLGPVRIRPGLFSLCMSLGLLLATVKTGPLPRNIETSFAVLLSIGWTLGTAFNTSNGGPVNARF